MKLIDAPTIGTRPADEFSCAGPVRAMPDPEAVTDQVWADYVFNRHNLPGVIQEWWCHTPSGTWYVVERHTERDEILKIVPAGEVFHA